jgi:hypothetical protein
VKTLKNVTAVLSLKDLDSPFIKDFTMKSYLHPQIAIRITDRIATDDLLNSACFFCSI